MKTYTEDQLAKAVKLIAKAHNKITHARIQTADSGRKSIVAVKDLPYAAGQLSVELGAKSGKNFVAAADVTLDSLVQAAANEPTKAKATKAKATKAKATKAKATKADPDSTAAARSAGVARSWADPDVAARRSIRDHVMVDGVEYRSVRAAFVALDLPLNEHILFRAILKEKRKMEGYERKWSIVSRS